MDAAVLTSTVDAAILTSFVDAAVMTSTVDATGNACELASEPQAPREDGLVLPVADRHARGRQEALPRLPHLPGDFRLCKDGHHL